MRSPWSVVTLRYAAASASALLLAATSGCVVVSSSWVVPVAPSASAKSCDPAAIKLSEPIVNQSPTITVARRVVVSGGHVRREEVLRNVPFESGVNWTSQKTISDADVLRQVPAAVRSRYPVTSAPGLDRVTAAMAKAAPAAGTFVGYAAATPVFVPFERSCSDRDDFIDGGVLLGIRPAVGVAACDRPAGGDAPVAARLVRAEWC